MPYSIFDIEVAEPLPALTTRLEDTGAAYLVRFGGRPVGFWMEALPGGTTLAPADLARRIGRHAGSKLLSERMRAELAPPATPDRLPALTVAVCTKDRPDEAARCLDALLALEPSALGLPVALEVLVVDNAPSDARTRTLVAARPEVRYVREPRPGLNFARNRALREATGELLAFLDDDVTVDRTWLTGLMRAWTEHPDAAAFTGLVLPYELATEAQILFERHGGFRRGFDTRRFYGQTRPGKPHYPRGSGEFGAGANMAFRRDVLETLDGFDEALDTGAPLPGGGDLDIFYRVVRAGYPLVYAPQYLAYHRHRRDLSGLRRQYESWGRGFMAFVVKSYRTDPSQRPKLRGIVQWWFKYQLWQLQKSLRGRHILPPEMILAELRGGVVGLLGEYPRSLRRIERIRQQVAAA